MRIGTYGKELRHQEEKRIYKEGDHLRRGRGIIR
jgi:hypothetical protein